MFFLLATMGSPVRWRMKLHNSLQFPGISGSCAIGKHGRMMRHVLCAFAQCCEWTRLALYCTKLVYSSLHVDCMLTLTSFAFMQSRGVAPSLNTASRNCFLHHPSSPSISELFQLLTIFCSEFTAKDAKQLTTILSRRCDKRFVLPINGVSGLGQHHTVLIRHTCTYWDAIGRDRLHADELRLHAE